MALSSCSDATAQGQVTPGEPAVQAQPEMATDGTPEGTGDQPAEKDLLATMRGNTGGGDSHPGKILYDKNCSQCHNQSVARAPDYSLLQQLPADIILHSLREGLMQPMAKALSDEEKSQVAEYIAGKVSRDVKYPPLVCKDDRLAFDYASHPFASGWGINRSNTRFIPEHIAKLNKEDVKKLTVRWSFAFPNMSRMRSQPVLVGGGIMLGSQDGTVYFLDEQSGCVRWTFRAKAEVRTGITVSDWDGDEKTGQAPHAYFADLIANVYALNLISGELSWIKKVDEHPFATGTGQPVLYDGVVYQPVSSQEEGAAGSPGYVCCNFRGSIVALDAGTGEIAWKSYTIKEMPAPAGTNSIGNPILAPSGSPVWNSPTVDEKRRLLYVGTGGNYSSPSQNTSNAIMAFSLDNGEIKWVRQTMAGDAFNAACFEAMPDHTNCPEENGPDADYGAPPIHISVDELEILVAGQKSGVAYGINPNDGRIVWEKKLGRGGNQGGVHFGLAAAGNTVFVPISDFDDGILPIEDARPGLYALNAFTGDLIWARLADNVCRNRKYCDPGIAAPITAIPGAVIAGHLDGRIRAYDSETGEILWQYDTSEQIETLSGEVAHGGSMSGGSGPIVANGTLYVTSGYGLVLHMPGNVLYAFNVPE